MSLADLIRARRSEAPNEAAGGNDMTPRARTERRARLSAAIDRLSALIEDGELLAASDPAALLHAATDLIEQGRPGWRPEPTDLDIREAIQDHHAQTGGRCPGGDYPYRAGWDAALRRICDGDGGREPKLSDREAAVLRAWREHGEGHGILWTVLRDERMERLADACRRLRASVHPQLDPLWLATAAVHDAFRLLEAVAADDPRAEGGVAELQRLMCSGDQP